jgi:hypothetical protein
MRRALPAAALLLMLALVGAAQAQVALDVNSSSKTSLSWTHTVGSGSNLAMVVVVSLSATGTHITGVTWSGTNPTFTCLFALNHNDSGGSSCGANGGGSARRVEIWGAALGSPGAIGGTITVTQSGSATVVAGSASFTGAAQTGTFGPAQGVFGGSGFAMDATATLNFTGISANAVVVDDMAISTSQPSTPNASQTLLWKAAGTSIYGASSYKGGATSVTMTQTNAGGSHWAYVGVPINPAPPAGRKGQTVVGRLEPIRGTVVPETRVN